MAHLYALTAKEHHPMTDRLTPEHEAEITERAAAATKGPWSLYESGPMIDVAADLEETGCGYRARREIARFEDEPLDNDPTHREWTAEEDWKQVRIDAEFVAHAREDVPALLAELAAVRAERNQARARITELERPAIEAKRREIRSSYVKSIAMAQEDRDYESAFNIECQLREREEQWKREDGEVA